MEMGIIPVRSFQQWLSLYFPWQLCWHLAEDGFQWMKLHPEGLEPVHVDATPWVAPLGCVLASHRDLLLLCRCGSTNPARLLQEQMIKNWVQLDLKQRKRRKNQTQTAKKYPSKNTVCVPSDCISMPTSALCKCFGSAKGEFSSFSVLCNRKGWGYSRPCWTPPWIQFCTSLPVPICCGNRNANSSRKTGSGEGGSSGRPVRNIRAGLPWEWGSVK